MIYKIMNRKSGSGDNCLVRELLITVKPGSAPNFHRNYNKCLLCVSQLIVANMKSILG